MAMAKEHRTVTRVTTILETVARSRDGARLSELAEVIDAPRSSAHGLIQGLVATGYLHQNAGRYVLGPALGALVEPRRPVLLEVAKPVIEDLVEVIDETAALCSLIGASVVYLDLVESSQPVRYVAPLRQRRPLYPTSAGKCFLAFMGQAERERHLANLDAGTRARAREELDVVRREGAAYNRGETVSDVAAVACPICVDGRVIACINVAGPMDRVLADAHRILPALRHATAQVQERLA